MSFLNKYMTILKIKDTSYLDFISFLISSAGLVVGIFLWVYSKNYIISYDLYKLVFVIGFFILLEFISLIYAIIYCIGKKKRQFLLIVNIIFSSSALLVLSLDYILLVF